MDRTDPLSFGPKFPEILVEWIAPCDIVKNGPSASTTKWHLRRDAEKNRIQKMEAKLSAKLQLLELTRGKTMDVAVSDNLEKIRRHKETLQTIVADVEELKRDIEQEKLEKGETVDEVKEWGEETEGKIHIVDNENS